MAAQTMEEAHRADSRLEQELRGEATRLERLGRGHRLAGTTLETACIELAVKLREQADHIVRVWD